MAGTEEAGFTPDDSAATLTAALGTPRFILGIKDGWHAIDPGSLPPVCPEHARTTVALCDRIVCVVNDAREPGEPFVTALYEPLDFPVALNRCPDCLWRWAAETGNTGAALSTLTGLAHQIATAILAGEDALTRDSDATVELLAHVSRHAGIPHHSEGCTDGDCDHAEGECPSESYCTACSLAAGSWAGEWEGRLREECMIASPCAPLLAVAASLDVREDPAGPADALAQAERLLAGRDAEIERLTRKLNAITQAGRPAGPLDAGTLDLSAAIRAAAHVPSSTEGEYAEEDWNVADDVVRAVARQIMQQVMADGARPLMEARADEIETAARRDERRAVLAIAREEAEGLTDHLGEGVAAVPLADLVRRLELES